MWCSVVRTARRAEDLLSASWRRSSLCSANILSLSCPPLSLRFLTDPYYKISHRRQHTMWALVALRFIVPLLLVLSIPTTTNAAVIPFDNNGGSSGSFSASHGMMCRPRLSGLVQQIRKSGDRESSWRELRGRESL